jgi:hypothetical protein
MKKYLDPDPGWNIKQHCLVLHRRIRHDQTNIVITGIILYDFGPNGSNGIWGWGCCLIKKTTPFQWNRFFKKYCNLAVPNRRAGASLIRQCCGLICESGRDSTQIFKLVLQNLWTHHTPYFNNKKHISITSMHLLIPALIIKSNVLSNVVLAN